MGDGEHGEDEQIAEGPVVSVGRAEQSKAGDETAEGGLAVSRDSGVDGWQG